MLLLSALLVVFKNQLLLQAILYCIAMTLNTVGTRNAGVMSKNEKSH